MWMARPTERDEVVWRKDRNSPDQERCSPYERQSELADVPTRLGRQPHVAPNTTNHDGKIGEPRQAREDQIWPRRVVNQLREEGRRERGEGIPEARGGGADKMSPATPPD